MLASTIFFVLFDIDLINENHYNYIRYLYCQKQEVSDVARYVDGLPEVDIFHIPVTAGDVDQEYKILHEGEILLSISLITMTQVRILVDGLKCVLQWLEVRNNL
jgi:hypothetical protein